MLLEHGAKLGIVKHNYNIERQVEQEFQLEPLEEVEPLTELLQSDGQGLWALGCLNHANESATEPVV